MQLVTDDLLLDDAFFGSPLPLVPPPKRKPTNPALKAAQNQSYQKERVNKQLAQNLGVKYNRSVDYVKRVQDETESYYKSQGFPLNYYHIDANIMKVKHSKGTAEPYISNPGAETYAPIHSNPELKASFLKFLLYKFASNDKYQ